MLVSEKNFLEKIADKIPGVAGYRRREARRDTDRRLRDWLAGRLDEGREPLHILRRTLTASGDLPALNEVGRVDSALQRAAAALRYADDGYSGLFDQLKIREDELDRLYAYDIDLVVEVESLGQTLRELAATNPTGETLVSLAGRVEELGRRIGRRREIFEGPSD